jgi:methionyl-tRNA formyltransferase
VPISQTARHLSLPTHTFDTFTGWSPPFSYNIVVAVSFGLLVPPRILGQASYGGLNVHPSLLPDLRGSAPIAHAILKQREYTGVSVQTLHPQHFDQGTILAQSLAPGVKIETNETAKQLEARLADIGADMLIDVLKSRSFVTPPQNVGWYAGPVDYAPKTTKQDRFIDFRTHTISEILAIQRALGDTWCLLPNGDRLIMHEMVSLDEVEVVNLGAIEKTGEPGLWVQDDSRVPLFRAACGRVGGLRKSTYAGGLAGKGNKKVKKLLQGKLSV